jgi:dynactin complex subunit
VNDKSEFSSSDKKSPVYRKSIENENVYLKQQVQDLKSSLEKIQMESASLQQRNYELDKENLRLNFTQEKSGFIKTLPNSP